MQKLSIANELSEAKQINKIINLKHKEMKKNVKQSVVVATIIAAAGLGSWSTLSSHQSRIVEMSLLLTENIEAQSWSFGEYWNRLDWNCVTINCNFYYSTIAQFAGEGKGTEAHSWCCPGCDTISS